MTEDKKLEIVPVESIETQVRSLRLDVHAEAMAFNQLQQSGLAMPQQNEERSKMPDA